MIRTTFIFITLSVLLGPTLLKAQSLQEYFNIAAENNPGLQAKFKAFEVAMQEIPQKSSLPDPTLSVGVFAMPVETRVGPQQARISLTQMFPWFGTLKLQKASTTLLAESKFQEFIAAKNKLYVELSSSYFSIQAIKAKQLVSEENISLLRQYKSIANAKFQNDEGSMIDILRVDMLLNEALTQDEILQNELFINSAIFNKILNRNSDSDILVSDLDLSYDSEIYQNIFNENKKNDEFNRHPIIQSFNKKIEAISMAGDLAQKQKYPKIGVGIDYVFVGENPNSNLSNNGKDALMPMVTLSLPVFGKKNAAAIKEADLAKEMTIFQQKDQLNVLANSYESAQFRLKNNLEFLDLYNKQVVQTEKSLQLLFVKYSNSGTDFQEVLRTLKQFLTYKKLQIEAVTAINILVVEGQYLTSSSEIN